jgi:hypothetical protein
MKPIQHFDLTVEQHEDGAIHLTQVASGQEDVICLHPDQLRTVAAALGVPVLTGTAAEIARRLEAVRDALDEADNAFLNSDIMERAGDAFEVYEKLKTAITLADEFSRGYETAPPVTPDRNGNAERQAAYRKRRKASTTPATDAPAA